MSTLPNQDDVHNGARLRAERIAQGFTVADLAERMRDTAPEHVRPQLPKLRDIERCIRGHEAAEHTVGPRYRILYARAFGTTEDELFGQSEPTPPTGTKREETPPTDEWDDMERRSLLRLAAFGVGAGTLASPGEAGRWMLNAALTSPPRAIDDWALACADHLHAIQTRPAQDVHNDVLLDLLSVQHQLREPGDEDTTELRRVCATLACLQANILTRLGYHGPALGWWRTARNAARASGDLQLALLIRSTEAGFGLYGLRSPQTVLRLTQEAQRLAGDRPSHASSLITSTRIKALSLLGRHQEALQILQSFRHTAPEDAPSDLFPASWTGYQGDFAASWIYAGAGEESAADEARDQVLTSHVHDYQYDANVRLHEALCTVTKGGIETGARQATAVVGELSLPYRTAMITATGRNVLRAVPPAQRHLPAVRELHEVLRAG
ncbi:helix-turn-helix domain-containing protein [Actinomadura sp. 9N407]|uniref:helix-turn-helix domain-containing protein n=1 Tax=Actinomadura sp. 9N407 TaxID=3375154 RepID=UPI00379CB3EC